MAFWGAGGGERLPFVVPLEDRHCHERGDRHGISHGDHFVDPRARPPPSNHGGPIEYLDLPERGRTHSTERHVYFIIREESPPYSATPTPPPPAPCWNDGSALRTASHENPVAFDSPYTPPRTTSHECLLLNGSHLGVRRHDSSSPPILRLAEPPKDISAAYAPVLRPPMCPDPASPPPGRFYEEASRPTGANISAQHHRHDDRPLPPPPPPVASWDSASSLAAVPADQSGVGAEEMAAILRDMEALQCVRQNFRRRQHNSAYERILLSLISPKSYQFDLDDEALSGIFSAVNEIFFNGELGQRVEWHWSDESSGSDYDSRIVGHTLFRKSRRGGFETYIRLSTPILTDPTYNRRLLISAFIHELIHCYLFIRCGFGARRCSGHTDGFRGIADIIDGWAGRGNLHLCNMEADLQRFRRDGRTPSPRPPHDHDHDYHHDFCYPPVTDDAWEQHAHHRRWDPPPPPPDPGQRDPGGHGGGSSPYVY